jgi:hypothetical protein
MEAAFVGKRVPTDARDVIEVKLQEEDQVEKVLLLEPETEESDPSRRGGTAKRSRVKG